QRTHRFVHRTSANHCLIELSILSSPANPRPLETKNLNSQRLLIGFLLCALTGCAAWHHGGQKSVPGTAIYWWTNRLTTSATNESSTFRESGHPLRASMNFLVTR